MKLFYAHSTSSEDKSDWQLLDEHLENVCTKAGAFAKNFGASAWGRILGKSHDMGKGSYLWQAYLRHVNNIVDEFSEFYDGHPSHAFTGAQWLYKNSKDVGKLLAYCIAGHHGGLPNWSDMGPSALKNRMEQHYPEIEIPHSLPDFPKQPPISFEQNRLGFQLQFFIRMLFSCLVDADFLDTERSLDKSKSDCRSKFCDFSELYNEFCPLCQDRSRLN
ncbi:CRISPR-associated endonuclease/helicase Cas3 [Desulfocicer vacuolatum DSM 3385]|uniref:CRISPR-associated endonuclease/helicase Cas3 n=2 Tax=Desulfocicer vacuolatum TaxID=2298 RepID=A0A1W2DMV7_9BACT|nr:CRISPR-associated endonuclease/helicase Cas3 [Desulfocicer vacuolatum DSM 3385]